MNDDLKIKVNPTFHEKKIGNKVWKKENNERYREYRYKWENNPKKFILHKSPIHLDIEASSACNLRCPMCSCTIEMEKGENSSYKPGFMEFDLYKKVIDDAKRIGVYSIKLNWRGEPLIHPNIVEMVKYAKENNIIDIMINTNAVNLDEKMSINLIKAGLDHLFISFDSIDKNKYEKYRVGANYDSVMSNIYTFSKINDEYGHTVETRIQKVLLNDTIDENNEFEKIFGKLVDKIAYEDYIPYGERGFGKSVEKDQKVKFACCQLWQRLFIEYNGNYAMCCDSQNEELILGNAYNQSISEIWNGKILSEIREQHKRGEWSKIPVCAKCYAPYM